jgi:uncharacterized protein
MNSSIKSRLRFNLLVPLLLLNMAPIFTSCVSADLYFSEYVEGSSNNKALEIYNNSNASVDLSGYKLEFYFNGNTSAASNIALTGSIAAKGVYVLANSNANSAILAVANQTSALSWYNGDDAVVLKNGAVVIDSIGQVGIDPGSEWGSGLTSTADNTLRRKLSVNGGDTVTNNSFDPSLEWDGFVVDSFEDLGRYQSNGGGGGGDPVTLCGETKTLISTIQGSGVASALLGNSVAIEAIVVASFQGANQIGGFFLQESDTSADANPATSEGIYVPSTVAVNVGDRVRVSGLVAETFNLTQVKPTSVIVCAQNQTLPSATPFSLPVSALLDIEAREAMFVNVQQTLTVSETFNLGRYGQVVLSNGRLLQPTNIVSPGAAANAQQALNNLNKIIVDDATRIQNADPVLFPSPGLSATNTLRSGDTVSNLTGVVSYDFNQYLILPTAVPQFVKTNPRPLPPTIVANTSLRVASFNVLNFFNGDGSGSGFPTSRGADSSVEFARQKAKILSALVGLNADVIGLLEIENDGYDVGSAITELVAELNTLDSQAQWAFVNPGLSKIGTDEISVGIIYRKDRATPIGQTAILDSSIEPLFLDTKNRPSMAQSFRATQGRGVVTLAINHLKSKGSACTDVGDADMGDGQGNCSATRTQAAQALVTWLSRNPTGVNDGDYLIIGDLNAYAKEDPITKIANAGYTDLIAKFGGAEAYSYVFDGQAGYLDHGLSSKSLTPQVLNAVDWHINADEPIVLDYNTEFKSANQISSFYANNPYRSSDHDPLVVSLKLVIDLDGDGDVDRNDIKQITDALNTSANELDQRDVNGDGIINLNDARALTLQCTRPRCLIQ